MEEVLTSEQNSRVKYLKKLYQKRRRKQENKFILEGYRIIKEAIAAGALIDSLFMTPEFQTTAGGRELTMSLADDRSLNLISAGLLNSLADTESPQGVIAVVDTPTVDLTELLKKGELVLVIDRIQDPGNMGTIIRTAAAAGVDGIIALKGSVDIYNLKVLRSTMGAIFNLPIITDLSRKDYLQLLEGEADRFTVVATALTESRDYNQVEYQLPLMLVIGNEANGVCPEILQISDHRVKIPIYGEIDSLNAAIACALALYKIVEKNSRIY